MNTTETYKEHTIIVDIYMGEKRYYQIISPIGKLIVDTLWNDDKMWNTDEGAIASAKPCSSVFVNGKDVKRIRSAIRAFKIFGPLRGVYADISFISRVKMNYFVVSI